MTHVRMLTAADVFAAQHEALALTWVAGKTGELRPLEPATARYPGMALVGHLNFIHPNRVQVVGQAEMRYLEQLTATQRAQTLRALFACPTSAMIVVTDGQAIPPDLIRHAETEATPLFGSPLPSPPLIHALQYYLAYALAEQTTLHGVFMEVIGVGVLLTGESGIGKSEVALELISRGHRLIADDAVELAHVAPDSLEGRCPDALRDFLEVRGLGILNIRAMFGETAIRRRKALHLIVHLEQMSRKRMQEIDRLQAERASRAILGVDIPVVVLLVAPGRNLAVLVEAAVRNHMLHRRGADPLQDFMQQQQAVMQQNAHAPQTHRPGGTRRR